MLKSIAVVAGSYLLSVVLVLAADPLLSRIFPGDFLKGRVPFDAALLASTRSSSPPRSSTPGSVPAWLRAAPRGMCFGSSLSGE